MKREATEISSCILDEIICDISYENLTYTGLSATDQSKKAYQNSKLSVKKASQGMSDVDDVMVDAEVFDDVVVDEDVEVFDEVVVNEDRRLVFISLY